MKTQSKQNITGSRRLKANGVRLESAASGKGGYRKRPIAAAVFAAMCFSSLPVDATDFSTTPFLGVGSSYGPNVLLALSVEYPTAGAAYEPVAISFATTLTKGVKDNKFSIIEKFTEAQDLKVPTLTRAEFEEADKSGGYVGYFDQAKCYRYDDANGYFTPDGAATNGYCGSKLYSGKLMNWLTMTSIDIYRMAMTGGNRAKGIGTGNADYAAGDVIGKTLLRRAYVNTAWSNNTLLNVGYPSNGLLGIGMRKIAKDLLDMGVFPTSGVQLEKDKSLRIHNNDFRLAVRKKGAGYQLVNGSLELTSDSEYKPMNVVVEVCKAGMLESNCTSYGNGYKPEGLMQENMRKIRFSVFGYLNNTSGNELNGYQDGGVMRARMKSLLGETTDTGVILGAEIDTATGQFFVNPDINDAVNSSVSNSGVINYLNKFGDSGAYRYYDPAGELYYAGLRYLRNKGHYDGYHIAENKIDVADNAAAKDNFPVIKSWNDPLLQQGQKLTDAAAVCRPNYIMYIGDTNTHQDNRVPNFAVSATDKSERYPKNYLEETNVNFDYGKKNPSDEVYPQTALTTLLTTEKSKGSNVFTFDTDQIGATGSYGSIIGLAAWARANDIREQVNGKQYVHSIFIDVVEGGNYKSSNAAGTQNKNAFYWAAKYGGFDADETELKGGDPAIRSRSQWTNDAENASSIKQFPDGVPKAYAAANSPDNMVKALKSSFNNISAKTETPSQTALGIEQNSGNMVDATASDKAVLLQSSYKKNDNGWQGDVLAYEYTTSGFKEKWKLSSKLEADFGSNQSGRQVWSSVNGTVIRFSSGNAATISSALDLDRVKRVTGSPANLINYVLGSRSNETGTAGDVFRTRPTGGLLGTVVGSTVGVLPKPTADVCDNTSRFDSIKNRETVYAFAANDGMLHVVGKDGSEKFAYIPSTVLPKLKDYASAKGEHVYINDGSPVMGEVCLSGGQTSVIVGTAGQGGEAVYAVDASRLGTSDTPSASNVLWEFTKSDDKGLGLTVHKPIIATVKDGNASVPVAVVSSGYNSEDGKGYLYVLKIGKSGAWSQGSNYWKIPLGKTGVGAPKTVDVDGDGNIDRIYVGDEAGKLWRADFNGSWSAKAIFEGSKPITGAPDVTTKGAGYTVTFSTGQYFNAVQGSSSKDEQNYAYGLFDNDGSPITEGSLLQQTVGTEKVATSDSGTRTYYKVSSNTLTANHKGWRLALPKGFISTDDAYVRSNKVAQFFAFSTNIDTGSGVNVCTTSGQTALIEVDVNTGGLSGQKLFDTNEDKRFDSSDAQAGVMITNEGLAMKRMNTVLIDQSVKAKRLNKVIWVDDTGTIKELTLNPLSKGLRRLSWREVFF